MPVKSEETGGLSRNERHILLLIRRHGPLPRARLAQMMGVSAQAVGNLSRKLVHAGYLTENEVVRGKVGQPSTPLSLADNAAFFLGFKIGRRLAELALVDFAGNVRMHRQMVHTHPEPRRLIGFARDGLATLCNSLNAAQRARISGVGIATPYRLWDWGEEMRGWLQFDLAGELQVDLPFPVMLENDATTACGAELIFGAHDLPRDFLHLYVAHFAGGGLVLDGALRHGPTRNAGAIGSMPMPGGGQVLDHASVSTLERMIGGPLPPDDTGWNIPPEIEREWAADAGRALAHAAMSTVAVADLGLVVLDGAVPPATRSLLARSMREALARIPGAGIDRPRVIEGSLGRSARILGAAGLPLARNFLPGGVPGPGECA
ncbi:ROK family transcriptional regulator [Paracoccus sp. 1_MG-2023]|uniref:ROK family transcriptional regulator n=1 Tax=unclassified Paracoccus (in: a-proteobacteria) TaxID=2688777 RepID=UPI001C08CBB6|nr:MULTISPECIES: ROK family transcriptional regulator [unclassified Paracoccus (in: a-proteobacteria)]MBU2959066.1 ROK family transcriptional regulator [Paracoccus sp. C2R09]MDO6669039.1 ROK family transcriptional regulator [Paracoccus sp. 1_MG-2023]